MTIKNRLTKIAAGTSLVSKAIKAIPDKYRNSAIGLGSVAAYVGGKQAFEDMKEGRKDRKQRQAQERYNRLMTKAASVEHMGRTPGQIFPLASESGAISWRQSIMDGLLENKDKMGKMSETQLKDLFPASGNHKGHKHGYRQRSMTTGKDAGSSLIKAFKAK